MNNNKNTKNQRPRQKRKIQDSNSSYKYKKKRSSQDDLNSDDNNQKCKASNVDNKKLDLRLYEFSYADFVLLSATIAYAIGEDLNDPDLDILIAFFGMITSDLAILRTRRGIIDGLAKAAANDPGEVEGVLGATESVEAAEDVVANLARKPEVVKNIKKARKRKVVRKSKNLK